ncbi:MAG: hypothetical protein NTW10_02170 [Bacteroidetes bacterium]|nr:hypothetical protein [Bacteroidota bacterium]
MKKFLFLLVIPFMMGTGSKAQTMDRQKMIQQVQSDVQEWLLKIPGGNEQGYGFANRDEFSQAKLGKQYKVYTLTGDFFKEELRPGKSYLVATGEWRIPLVVNQVNRALITVNERENQWKIVSLGARVLAGELQEFDRYPELVKNSDLTLLRVYQLQSDFLLSGDPSSSATEVSVYPMHSAILNMTKLKESAGIKMGLNELLSDIKESIR